jgi:hypothetical protein
LSRGVAFNLANNAWGTNYVMWQPYKPEAATMRFRFRISSDPAGPPSPGLSAAAYSAVTF